jgi:hypothetical protein
MQFATIIESSRGRLVAFVITFCASYEICLPPAVTTEPVKKSLRVAFALICPYISVAPSHHQPSADDGVDHAPGLLGRHHCPPSSRPAEPVNHNPPVPTITQNVTHRHDGWLSCCCLIPADLRILAEPHCCSSHVRTSRNHAETRPMRKIPRGQPCAHRNRQDGLELTRDMVGVVS